MWRAQRRADRAGDLARNGFQPVDILGGKIGLPGNPQGAGGLAQGLWAEIGR